MKRAQIHGPDDLRIDDVEAPQPGPRDVVLSVGACGICGSDVGYVRLGGVGGPTREPMPLGHELAGTVIAIGSEVEEIRIGARVVVNPGSAGHAIGNGGTEGGFAKQLLVRDAALGLNLFPIPDHMPFRTAALAEPLGVGMNAVDRVAVTPGEKVAVMGAGPIGLAAMATLLDRGIEDVVAVDLSPTRLEVARKLGVSETIHAADADPWAELARLHGTIAFYGAELARTDVFIEASGAASVLSEIIERAAPRARVSIVALHRQPIEVDFMIVMMKQMTLQGAMEYPDRYEEMIELLDRRDLSPMITHRFGFDDFLEAFRVAQSPSRGAKVMIEFD